MPSKILDRLVLYTAMVTCTALHFGDCVGQEVDAIELDNDSLVRVINPLSTPVSHHPAAIQAGVDVPANSRSEIWEISTRHLPDRFRSINTVDPGFEVNQLSGGCWYRSSLENALNSESILTILYVHGNFMERDNARQRVRIIDAHIRRRSQSPYRLLMLSWPSQPEHKILRDAVLNAESAECHALYVAWLLERLAGQPRVSLFGFSYGARSITGALHLSAGGTIPGLNYVSTLPERNTNRYRVGLAAPALDRWWLSDCGRHKLALTNVDQLMNLYNSRDPVLRRFRFLDLNSKPIAAGLAGFAGIRDPRVSQPLDANPLIRQFDCANQIGHTHSERSYYADCGYFGHIIDNLLWNDLQ